MAKRLGIFDTLEILSAKDLNASGAQSSEQMIEIMLLRQKVSRSVQYAALELEEALANVDGDLAVTNQQLAYFSGKHDRAVMLNNIATFVGSGTLGILDSASGIKYAAPVPNIFGITGNSIAVGLPLLGLHQGKYKSAETNVGQGNMLAPIFGKKYQGAGYDPVIWSYVEGVPANSTNSETRRATLLKSWQSYRGLGKGSQADAFINAVTDVSKDRKISLDILRARSEFLVDLRALIQRMYKDISDLNSSVLNL